MSAASVWFVRIDEKGNAGKPGLNPPSASTGRLPRVTTIHVVNYHSGDHTVSLKFDETPPGKPSGDIVVDVPKM